MVHPRPRSFRIWETLKPARKPAGAKLLNKARVRRPWFARGKYFIARLYRGCRGELYVRILNAPPARERAEARRHYWWKRKRSDRRGGLPVGGSAWYRVTNRRHPARR